MIKFRTGGWGQRITVVEVERETESSVWIKGNRHQKRASYDNYFDSWEEARDHLLRNAEQSLNAAQSRLARAERELQEVKDLWPE